MDRRRGSALLIVLGFLSFMVVSAVAFSIYMRSERVPSSVFRRKAVSRQLVHAAVARAISDLDNAIRADPFPGVHSGDVSEMKNGGRRFFDEWHGRVFMPPNPGITACSVHNGKSQVSKKNQYCQDVCIMAPKNETAAVLNLEALGYVPAPLFNDVRILSRLTWSAKWRPFDQGAGRYAYVAVNVSDYLDANRLKDVADAFRSSGNRINLTALLSGGKYDDSAIDRAETFRKHARGGTVNNGRNAAANWPFVSLLDFYLDMRDGYADCLSPFYQWIGASQSGSGYDSMDLGKIKAQCFVTDSWYPPSPAETVAGSAIIDLNHREDNYPSSAKEYGQPFPVDFVKKDNKKSLRNCLEGAGPVAKTPFFRRLAFGTLPPESPVGGSQGRSLTPVDAVLLKDYLDRDDTPTSLALPCVERVPMVAAIQRPAIAQSLALKLESEEKDIPSGEEDGKKVLVTFSKYQLDDSNLFNAGMNIKAAIVFPFKRGDVINQKFTAKALVRVFLVEDCDDEIKDDPTPPEHWGANGLRAKGGENKLKALRPSGTIDWNESKLFSVADEVTPFVFTLVSGEVDVDPTGTDILTQDDVPLGSSGGTITFPLNAPIIPKTTIVTRRVKTLVTPAREGIPESREEEPPEFRLDVSPYDKDGNLFVKKVDDDSFMDKAGFEALTGKFTLQAAVWIRVEDKNHHVVDLVPAIADDSNVYNGIQVFGEDRMYDGSGNGPPIFRFRSKQPVSVDVKEDTTPELALNINSSSFSPRSYFVVDPRFNWAPEDWLPRDDVDATGDNWIEWVTGRKKGANGTEELLGVDGRDTDVFMFASNQGFLQSMGELAFLPRVTEFGDQTKSGAPTTQTDLLQQGSVRMDGAEHSTDEGNKYNRWDTIANHQCVWRTYSPFKGGDGIANVRNFYDEKTPDTTAFRDFGDRGVRVNPYSDNESVLMSAFAYTPYDWWAAAGTNTCYDSQLDDSSNTKDNKSSRISYFGELDKEYTFSSGSSQAKLSDDNLKAIAGNIKNTLRSSSGDWQSAYDNLDWYGNDIDPSKEDSFKNFLGVTLDEPLHSVDRKFLYSYWRGCLANRQQLFLVFERAESGALGSGGEGKMPPQQGGRGVALVWRDPETPIYPGKSVDEARDVDRKEYVKYDTGVDSGPRFRKPHRTRILFYHQFD